MSIASWACWIFGLVAASSIIRDMIGIVRCIREIRLDLKRLKLRKQDWTPREDPALWKADGR